MSLITRDLLANHHSSNQSKLPDLKSGADYLEKRRSTNTNRATDQTVFLTNKQTNSGANYLEKRRSTNTNRATDQTVFLTNKQTNSGADYLEKRRSTNTNRATDQTAFKLQDLNQPPILNQLLDDTNLDLKLVSLSSSSSPPLYTLCKVKFALERAEKEHTKKRSMSMSKSFEETDFDDEAYASGCPSCLLYVLISSSNPKCPRCNMIVPSLSPTNMKKPRIDLNITI